MSSHSPKKYNCTFCDIETNSKKDYAAHLLTLKHKHRIKSNILEPESPEKPLFVCKMCNKEYKARNSLWYHEQKCINPVLESTSEPENVIVDASSNEIKVLTNLVLELVKSNSELQKQMLEVCKNSNTTISNSNSNNSNNNNNSNNKTFNLQFFLNEQCKDAMNLSDFVKSVQLSLPDLEKVDEQGYVNGMSNLIISKLKELDVYKRPVHCSDSKRDTMHVKDDDKWEREDPENSKLTIAVKDIEKKNFSLINAYREKYPDCVELDSIHNDKYLHMMMTLAASGPDEYKKVVKKLAKEMVIDKERE